MAIKLISLPDDQKQLTQKKKGKNKTRGNGKRGFSFIPCL